MASLRNDVDAILNVWVLESEATPAEPAEDTVLAALFTTSTAPLPLPHERAKRHQSRESEEDRDRKKEHTELEATRRAFLLDEEARQMKARELAARASSSKLDDVERSTTEGADIAEDTTDGVPTTDGAGSGKTDPPAY